MYLGYRGIREVTDSASVCPPIIPDYTTQIEHFTSDYFRPLRSIFSQKQVISNLCGQANAIPLSNYTSAICLFLRIIGKLQLL